MQVAGSYGRFPLCMHTNYKEENVNCLIICLHDLSGLLLRTLVVGKRQQSESIEVALDMELLLLLYSSH